METYRTPRALKARHLSGLLLLLIAPFVCGFNLDTEHPRTFPSPQNSTAFGHRVCDFGSRGGDSVLVTDPLYSNGTGGVYSCSYGDSRCKPVRVDVQPGSVFGLSLACRDRRAVVCGPHLVQKCEGFNYLNGICAELNPDLTVSQTLRPAFQGPPQDPHRAGMMWVVDHSQHCSDTQVYNSAAVSDPLTPAPHTLPHHHRGADVSGSDTAVLLDTSVSLLDCESSTNQNYPAQQHPVGQRPVGSVLWGSVLWGSVLWGSVLWGSILWGSVLWGSVLWAVSCGAASCGAASCGAASCGAASCGAASCGAASCGAASCGAASCGAASCGAASCGAASCGAASCGAASCGAASCRAASCGAASCGAASCGQCPVGSVLWGSVLWAASCGAASCGQCPVGSVLWGSVLWAASCGQRPVSTDEGLEDDQHCTVQQQMSYQCHVILPLDAVILFDDSQSITDQDFKTMIQFIKDIIKAFIDDPRAQVGVAKYSTQASAVFHFENFGSNRDADKLMKDVSHAKGQTHTSAAISFVLNDMFQKNVGMRNTSQKLLVVITDGKSNDDKPPTLDAVIRQAEERGITRFAIGVGHEYSREELIKIASSSDLVFETKSFSTLTTILSKLTQRIFAIEGANVGKSIQLELSQGGFSVALSEEATVFGAVGMFSWSGGLEEKRLKLNASFINASNLQENMEDSYLGYSVAVATVEGKVVYFAGAPRHKHMGMVLGFSHDQDSEGWMVTHRANGSQLGSYFGAELCVLDGLLAVGAPLFHAAGVGGEVTVYTLSTMSLNSSGVLRGAAGNMFGRFGSALAALQDLNGDGLLELGVGAPHEDKGRGAVYVFLSQPGGFKAKHSQRVGGSALDASLKYFGVSLHSAVDLSSDGLPDIVVGSKGKATVLRTHPVICANVYITLNPPVISQNHFHCSAPYAPNTPIANAKVCVNMTSVSVGTIQGPLYANVSVIMELDSGPQPRLLFSAKSPTEAWNSIVSTTTVCSTYSITIPRCISDYHEVPLSGKLTVMGETVKDTGLKPVQHPDCVHTFRHMVLLEKVCGKDHMCISDLNISLKFSRDMVVKTEDFPLNLSVVVVNNGEDAAETELLFRHPSIFSFTRMTALESIGHAWCTSNNENLTSLTNITHTTCRLGATVFRHKARVVLNLTFRVSEPAALHDQLTVNASVTSKNENPETLHDNSATASVPVKQLVNFLLENEGSTQYIRYDQNSLINHTFKLVNLGKQSIPLNVTFVVPLKLSSGFLWDVSSPVVNGSGVKCENPEQLTDSNPLHTQHCNGSSCQLIKCGIRHLSTDRPISFQFRGHVTSQTKVSGVQVAVVTWGSVRFDEQRYTQYLNEDALQLSIVTDVEFPSQAQTVLIASLSIFFGLLAMAIIFYLLYKVGFLKSKSQIPDQQGALISAPSGGEGDTPADCHTTETVADEEAQGTAAGQTAAAPSPQKEN
ncbi:hypothetical protein NFI96_010880 [Prochilodus magdalenae]|nr:hypothetical protein NFI96_010880 [Prochilodus magdalenae]